MPGEIKQQLEALENDWRQQHTRFSEQQKCLFIHSDWLGRIEASLQDVGEQIRQAQINGLELAFLSRQEKEALIQRVLQAN